MSDPLKAWLPCLEHGSIEAHQFDQGPEWTAQRCPGGREVLLVPSHDFAAWEGSDLCRICEDYESEHVTTWTIKEDTDD